MKVKLDDFNIRVLINGLYRQGRDYDSETNAEINALLFRLVDIRQGSQLHFVERK